MLPEGMKKRRGVMWDTGDFERLALWNLLSYKGFHVRHARSHLTKTEEGEGRIRVCSKLNC